MKPQLIRIATVAIVALACFARPAHAQYFAVGSFNKPAATGVQTVPHTLPAACACAPTAIIFWMAGGTTAVTGGSTYSWGFGVSDGGNGTSRAISANGLAGIGANAGNAARRMSAAAITIVKNVTGTLTLEAEADLRQPTPWDTTNFYLNWTNTTDTTAYAINFLVIGGSSVQAKVVDWTSPAGTGAFSYTSLTFLPAVVLHFGVYDTSALPHNSVDAGFMFGVMDAAGDQFANTFYVRNNSASSTTATARKQLSSNAATLVGINSAGTATVQAAFTSPMLTNGFQMNFSTNSIGAQHFFSLALGGINANVGTFNRPSPTCNPCTGVTTTSAALGFTPGVVLLSTVSSVTSATFTAGARFGVSAADGTNFAASHLTDQNGLTLSGSTKTVTKYLTYPNNGINKVAVDADRDDGFAGATATTMTFPAGQFQIGWGIINSAGLIEYGYLALGPMNVTSVTLSSFTATRLPDGKTRLDWRTGYEVDNVGFRLYREQNGKRVRITSSLVPGTALVGIGRGVSNGGRTYTWSDPSVSPDTGPVQYWLEDVDLKGKSTWHGPIVPTAAPPREPR